MRVRVLIVDVDRRTERNQLLAAAGCEPATLVAEFTSQGNSAHSLVLPATSDASEQHQYQIRIEVID